MKMNTRRFIAVISASMWGVSSIFSVACSQEASQVVSSIADPTDAHEDDFVALFNGESLEGWEGNEAHFRVEDQVIIAGNLNTPIDHNYFLCTTKEFTDFELQFEVKLIGPGQNAGVQFRSKRIENSTEVSGYQCDVGAAWERFVWGALYDESRRNRMLAEGDPDQVDELVRRNDWNQLKVLAEGNRIQIFLNGERTIDYQEPEKVSSTGVIGLQIHSGPPSEAHYRNIRIREIESK